ncbi:hypothetical protein PIROE2DRAFT_17254, partial [Piromyces sp. E2]
MNNEYSNKNIGYTMYDFDDCEYKSNSGRLYHVEFEKIAKRSPKKCAFIFENNEYTFSQINEMSNSLAFYLREYGIKRNDIVPIICERSQFFVVAVLAIMKAGGAFVHIDPYYPEEHKMYLVSEVKAKLILKYLSIPQKLFNTIDIFEYDLKNHDYHLNTDNLPLINQEEDLCCVVFTSGTTGKPKGVLINHFGLVNTCKFNEVYYLKKCVRDDIFSNILAASKLSFTASIIEIFYSFYHQIKVILCNNLEQNDPNLIGQLITNFKIDLMLSPPTRIKTYLNDSVFRNAIHHLKVLIFIAENANLTILNEVSQYTNALLYNMYGLSEIYSMCLVEEINREYIINNKQITSGKPAYNYKIFILDEEQKPVKVGVEGIVYIASNMISKGYLNDGKLTDDTFIDCPFPHLKGTKMIKTGDIGKWTNDGKVIILGRRDFQVKIAGQKINIGEIENILKEIKALDYSVVVDKNDKNGNKFLACYYITKKDISGRFIRNYLTKRIPSYMIPKYYKKIDKIPMNDNGKFNRSKLPDIDNNVDIIYEDVVEPITVTEKKLCKILSKILNINCIYIGCNSNFYELGGDSLNVIQ